MPLAFYANKKLEIYISAFILVLLFCRYYSAITYTNNILEYLSSVATDFFQYYRNAMTRWLVAYARNIYMPYECKISTQMYKIRQ